MTRDSTVMTRAQLWPKSSQSTKIFELQDIWNSCNDEVNDDGDDGDDGDDDGLKLWITNLDLPNRTNEHCNALKEH